MSLCIFVLGWWCERGRRLVGPINHKPTRLCIHTGGINLLDPRAAGRGGEDREGGRAVSRGGMKGLCGCVVGQGVESKAEVCWEETEIRQKVCLMVSAYTDEAHPKETKEATGPAFVGSITFALDSHVFCASASLT